MLRRFAILLVSTPLLIGGVRCATTSGRSHEFACARDRLAGATFDSVARCDRGATVSASSTDFEDGHHPLFMVDGRVGGAFETWSSFPGDRAPWVEIALPAPISGATIVLHHRADGAPSRSRRAFALRVLQPGRWTEVVREMSPDAASTTFPAPAGAIEKIRIEFHPGGLSDPPAQLAEVQVLAN